jgi:hypothetical protein
MPATGLASAPTSLAAPAPPRRPVRDVLIFLAALAASGAFWVAVGLLGASLGLSCDPVVDAGCPRAQHRLAPLRSPPAPDPDGALASSWCAVSMPLTVCQRCYGSRANWTYLRRRGIKPRIARRLIESSARLGRHGWKVERSLSWLSCWRRLQVRLDRDAGR